MEIKEKVSLVNYNTWRVGGEADYFCLPESIDDIKYALKWAYEKKIPYSILGGGSNVLISDKGVRGLVICFKKFSGISDVSNDEIFKVECLSGTLKQKVMRQFLKVSLPPSLFLSGLPGDIGGGVVMNAGVGEKILPREFVEIVESFKVLEFKPEAKTEEGVFTINEYKNQDVEWGYRHSKGWGEKSGIVISAVLSWKKSDVVEGMREKVKAAQELRSSKQPLSEPSCGSVFRNPPGEFSSGALIESCGLKGYQYGGAEVSRKHANFIVNKGSSTALDIHCVMSLVKNKVKLMKGVDLQAEVKYFGDWKDLI